jgi:hypothetical protein
MLRHFFLLFLWGPSLGYAQTDRADPYLAVTAFFEAFHQADGPALAAAWHPEARLYSTQLLPDGSTRLRAAVVADFVQAVAQRPAAPTWEEQLDQPTVLLDFPMAQVWVPYRFYRAGEFSHRGTNNFLLLWENNRWQILHLIDTRVTDRP